MEDKIDKLYEKYLTEKLDAIFDDATYDKNKTNIKKEKSNYSKVTKDNKENYVDKNGKLISDKWYDIAYDFHNGFALVGYRIVDDWGHDWYYYYFFIDTNGEYVSEQINQSEYNRNKFFKIKKDGKYNYIDKNRKLLSDVWFDNVCDFSNGYAAVVVDKKWNYIDENGKLLSDTWFDGTWDFSKDSAFVKIGLKKEKLTVLPNFICVGNKIIPRKIEMGDYQVKKTLTGYECKTSADKYQIKYKPIKRYGYRYTLCLNKDKVILYDRIDNKYFEIADVSHIQYDDNFIIVTELAHIKYSDNYTYDYETNKIYLMYENQMLDITNYYNKKLKKNANININRGITDILSKDEFIILNDSQIQKLFDEEHERKIKDQEKKKEEDQKFKLNLQKEFQSKNISDEQEKKKNRKLEAIETIQKCLAILKDEDMSELKINREKVEKLFVEKGNYKEIDEFYKNILMFIDLTLEDFTNAKVSGVDFKGTNISFNNFFNPQKVYNKDLRGCDFTGLFIDPMTNFNGVDIRGAKFSIDNDEKTYDMFNITFKNAIYDDTTTYNGVPISKYIEYEKQQHEKYMNYLESLKEENKKDKVI